MQGRPDQNETTLAWTSPGKFATDHAAATLPHRPDKALKWVEQVRVGGAAWHLGLARTVRTRWIDLTCGVDGIHLQLSRLTGRTARVTEHRSMHACEGCSLRTSVPSANAARVGFPRKRRAPAYSSEMARARMADAISGRSAGPRSESCR
jgi:hypothetical protein